MRTISFANSGPDFNISSGPSGWPGDRSPHRRVHPVLGGSGWLGDTPGGHSNPGAMQEFEPMKALIYEFYRGEGERADGAWPTELRRECPKHRSD